MMYVSAPPGRARVVAFLPLPRTRSPRRKLSIRAEAVLLITGVRCYSGRSQFRSTAEFGVCSFIGSDRNRESAAPAEFTEQTSTFIWAERDIVLTGSGRSTLRSLTR